jgi:RND family efflux transporter MFP subunit
MVDLVKIKLSMMGVTSMSDSSSFSSGLRKAAVLIGILLIAVTIASIIYTTAPKPQRGEEEIKARLVETTELKRMTLRPEWLGSGEISAAQRVQLSAQVSGRIALVNPQAIPGATLAKDQIIATIEKQDYELQVQQHQAAVVQAQATLDLEQGQAQLAKEEYELAKNQLDTSLKNNALVLRKPQIASAEAGLKTAQVSLALAQLQLFRTDIRMPFNGQIVSRNINNGSQVTTNSMLFDLVSMDEFWLQVKVPQHFLAILDVNEPVVVTSGDYQREAEVLHSLIEVDDTDRQAKILISIKNPDSKSLLIGSYVDSLLFAKTIPDAYVIENRYVKDDGRVWVVNDNQLFKRTLNIFYQSREYSWVNSGFLPGDSLLNSSLGVVTEGTPVRTSTDRGQQ